MLFLHTLKTTYLDNDFNTNIYHYQPCCNFCNICSRHCLPFYYKRWVFGLNFGFYSTDPFAGYLDVLQRLLLFMTRCGIRMLRPSSADFAYETWTTMSYTCNWKRCKSNQDLGVRSNHNQEDYWLCQVHWKQLCEVSDNLCDDVHKMCKPVVKDVPVERKTRKKATKRR